MTDAPALRPPKEYERLRWHWIKQSSGNFIVMTWTIGDKWADPVGYMSPERAWEQGWRYHGPCYPAAIVIDPERVKRTLTEFRSGLLMGGLSGELIDELADIIVAAMGNKG